MKGFKYYIILCLCLFIGNSIFNFWFYGFVDGIAESLKIGYFQFLAIILCYLLKDKGDK